MGLAELEYVRAPESTGERECYKCDAGRAPGSNCRPDGESCENASLGVEVRLGG